MRTTLVLQLQEIVVQCCTDLKNNGLTRRPVYSTLCRLNEKGDGWGHTMWHAPKTITEALRTINGKKVVVLVDKYEAPWMTLEPMGTCPKPPSSSESCSWCF